MLPDSLRTQPLGSGRRLNVIRSWMAHGLTPSAIQVAGEFEPFDYARLANLTDVQHMHESTVRVWFHPAILAQAAGKPSTWAGWIAAADTTGLQSAILVPDPALHTNLLSQGAISGTTRKRTRLVDFNLVAYLIATRCDAWKDTRDIATIRALQVVLEKLGDIETRAPMLPALPDFEIPETTPVVSAKDASVARGAVLLAEFEPPAEVLAAANRVLAEQASPSKIPPAWDRVPTSVQSTTHYEQYQALGALPVGTGSCIAPQPLTAPAVSIPVVSAETDLDALEASIKAERVRREQAASQDQWAGATVVSVSFDPPESIKPSFLMLRLQDGSTREIYVG